MDVLIAIGTSVAFLYSLVVVFLPGRLPSATYFDASALIITLILTGNYLEHLTRVRAGSALGRLEELLPRQTQVMRSGVLLSIPSSEVLGGTGCESCRAADSRRMGSSDRAAPAWTSPS